MTLEEKFIDYRNKLIDTLTKQVCKVYFKRKDGVMRQMVCTLRSDMIPVSQSDKPRRTKTLSTISVFDLEKKEWRSFIINNLWDIEILNTKK